MVCGSDYPEDFTCLCIHPVKEKLHEGKIPVASIGHNSEQRWESQPKQRAKLCGDTTPDAEAAPMHQPGTGVKLEAFRKVYYLTCRMALMVQRYSRVSLFILSWGLSSSFPVYKAKVQEALGPLGLIGSWISKVPRTWTSFQKAAVIFLHLCTSLGLSCCRNISVFKMRQI